MKNSIVISRSPLLIAMVILTVILLSCENKIDFIPKSDFITLPSVTAKNFETVYSDSGRLQLIITSPLAEQYDTKDNPHADFKSGIKVQYFDGKAKPEGYVTAKYARYTKTDNIWELRDSVVVLNQNNDKLETEVLFWNQDKDFIYTDRFVKITNEDQIIQGFGFESDARLVKRRIKKVTATIYLKNEE
ncbi:MAG: LPS export ABC transporter periplasmic protein LptC [Bacteroidetes bacterium]|nr:MAG: LPS export ABC transporter periplasmic protein LptC [Bacteroidota bacterium]